MGHRAEGRIFSVRTRACMKYLKQEEDGMLKQAEIAERQGNQCEDDVRANWGSRQYLDLLFCGICWSSLLAQLVKNLPAGQETQI